MSNGMTTSRGNWAQQLFEWVDNRFPLSALWKPLVCLISSRSVELMGGTYVL